MTTITTTDGARISYTRRGKGKTLVMVPGWSCSARFFDRNVEVLGRSFDVVTVDLRGHGQSPDPAYGHRIARYAADVRDLLNELDCTNVTLLGWSMGGAILWSYFELFGRHRIDSLIFVDQSPRQYFSADWKWGSTGVYDAQALAALETQLLYDSRGSAEGTVMGCHYGEVPSDELAFFADQIELCPPAVRAAIMADHTNLDWRDLLPRIDLPSLVLVGRQSAIFPWRGSAYVGEKIPGARTEFFEHSGHMPFWQESERFNAVVSDFVATVTG